MSNNYGYPPPPSDGGQGLPLGKDSSSDAGSSGAGSRYPSAPQQYGGSAPQQYGGSQGYPSPHPGGYAGGGSGHQSDDKSILALVLSIASFVFLGIFLSIPALIISGNVLKENPYDGKAKAARIISWVNIGFCILVALFWILAVAVGVAAEGASY